MALRFIFASHLDAGAVCRFDDVGQRVKLRIVSRILERWFERLFVERVATPPHLHLAQIQQVLAQYPEARWVQWEALPRDNTRAGARLADRAESARAVLDVGEPVTASSLAPHPFQEILAAHAVVKVMLAAEK